MKFSTVALIASAVCAVSAHTIFTDLITSTNTGNPRYVGMRLPSYDGPITDVTTAENACNGGPNPLTQISTQKLTVKAGETVTLQWRHTLVAGNDDIVDASHLGPIMVYMAKVSDSVTSAPPVSGWFKIYEDGYTNGVWAVTKLIQNKGLVSVTIPSCIPSGDYLFRGELIALHGAQSYPGAQFYMECAQLTVTNGGSTVPDQSVSFPGTYKGSDPGISFNLYNGFKSYTIPGPRPWTCGSTPSSPSPSPSPKTSPATSPVTSPATSPSPVSGNCLNQYQQCGGQTYTGGTLNAVKIWKIEQF
ncbi:hypothetical protein HK098_003735 [Nowakowskiella sp. JEL0407]|nr:hypothetical protein HK098_003735 [Nowakowskiella sp. JEL0407]